MSTSKPAAENRQGDAVENALNEDVETLRTNLWQKLQVEVAEEAKMTPEVANQTTEEAVIKKFHTEDADGIASGRSNSNVAEKPPVDVVGELKHAAGEAKPAIIEVEAASGERPRPRVVLICFDDSEHSLRAVKYYARGLSRPDDRVVLMHAVEVQELIIPMQPTYWAPITSTTFYEDMERLKSKMTKKGVEFQTLLTTAGVKSRIYVIDGTEKPGVYIVRKAAQLDANMIVIGSRGLGVIRRSFMGSVSDYVLHHAGCATCVVPSPHRR